MILWDRITSLIDGLLKKDRMELHTFALGKIESFDPVSMRAEVYLLENIRFDNKFYQSQTIVDCLVSFPHTNGFYIRIPYQKGDKVVVAFAESDIADIMITGDRTNQKTTRRHSEDDLIVISGWSKNDENTISSNANDLVVFNKKHNSSIIFTEGNNVLISNVSDVNVQCDNATVNASKTTINSVTEINGKTTINGNTSIVGALDVSQSVSTPNVSASSSLSVSGKEMKGHTHTTTKEGQPTSPPN
ncbi:MAG: Gp138 family membrane-puncturing spike protein [Paraclostridium sp.]